jgi:hypothetical protein
MRYGALTSSVFLLSLVGACVETDDLAASAQATRITGPAFYVDGTAYRTVGTPTALPSSAPAHSFDTIYNLGGLQLNVADSAPGLPGYNGGRWQVHAIQFASYADALAAHDANDSGTFDFASEIEAALGAGDAIDLGIVASFECPVIKL